MGGHEVAFLQNSKVSQRRNNAPVDVTRGGGTFQKRAALRRNTRVKPGVILRGEHKTFNSVQKRPHVQGLERDAPEAEIHRAAP